MHVEFSFLLFSKFLKNYIFLEIMVPLFWIIPSTIYPQKVRN